MFQKILIRVAIVATHTVHTTLAALQVGLLFVSVSAFQVHTIRRVQSYSRVQSKLVRQKEGIDTLSEVDKEKEWNKKSKIWTSSVKPESSIPQNSN